MQSRLRQPCCSGRTACMTLRPGWMIASLRDFRGGADHHILVAGYIFLGAGLSSSRVTFERFEKSLCASCLGPPPTPATCKRSHCGYGRAANSLSLRQSSECAAAHALFFPLVPKRIELWPVKWVAWRLCLLQQAFCLTFVDSLELPFFPLAQQQCATLTPHTHTCSRCHTLTHASHSLLHSAASQQLEQTLTCKRASKACSLCHIRIVKSSLYYAKASGRRLEAL